MKSDKKEISRNLVESILTGSIPKPMKHYNYDNFNNKFKSFTTEFLEYFNQLPKAEQECLLKDNIHKKNVLVFCLIANIIELLFDNISKSLREELLEKLSEDENKKVRIFAANAILTNYRKLPKHIQSYIFEFSKYPYYSRIEKCDDGTVSFHYEPQYIIRKNIIKHIASDFDSFPKELQNILLESLEDKKEVRRDGLMEILNNLDKFPQTTTQKFVELVKNGKLWRQSSSILKFIDSNYDNLPADVQELVNYLDPYRVCRQDISEFKDVDSPKDLKVKQPKKLSLLESKKLKQKISDGDSWEMKDAASIILRNFDRISENTRNEILRELVKSKDYSVLCITIYAIAKHYNNLPADIQQVLKYYTVRGSSKVRGRAINAIAKNYNNLPEDVQEVFINFEHDKELYVRGRFTSAIALFYDNLPEKAHVVLKKFVREEEFYVKIKIMETIIRNYNSVSKDVQSLLKDFAEDPDIEVREKLNRAILKYGDLPPKDFLILLEKLQCGIP